MFIKIFENRVCNLRFALRFIDSTSYQTCQSNKKMLLSAEVSTTTTGALLILIFKYIIY